MVILNHHDNVTFLVLKRAFEKLLRRLICSTDPSAKKLRPNDHN